MVIGKIAPGKMTALRSARMQEDPPRPFIADRPFLFLIRETRTGLILFLGRVCKP